MKIPGNLKAAFLIAPSIAAALDEVADFAGIAEATLPEQIGKTLAVCTLLVKCLVVYAQEHGAMVLDSDSLQEELQELIARISGNPDDTAVPMPAINSPYVGDA